MKLKLSVAALCLAACGSAFAGQYADALGKCMYNNSTDEEKTTITQWAFVTLGKTDAARQITRISDAKTKEVNNKAKSAVTRLATGPCMKDAANTALREGKSGAQDAAVAFAGEMLKDKLAQNSGSLGNFLSSSSGTGTGLTNENIQNAASKLKTLFGR